MVSLLVDGRVVCRGDLAAGGRRRLLPARDPFTATMVTIGLVFATLVEVSTPPRQRRRSSRR
jgi:hypothetical protein